MDRADAPKAAPRFPAPNRSPDRGEDRAAEPTRGPAPNPPNRAVPEAAPAEDSLSAAIEIVRRLTLEASGEAGALEETGRPRGFACAACGRENPTENRFCSRCGVPLDPAVWGAARSPDPGGGPARRGKGETTGEHHYHHHYHHHYFAGEGAESSAVSLPSAASHPAPAVNRSSEGAKRGSPGSSEPVSRSESAARKVSEHWALACNTRHLDDLVELYSPDAIVMRPNVPPIRGTSAIREFFVAVLDAGLGEVELEPLRTEFMGDVAYEAGRCKMLVPVAMGKRREERGKYLMVMTRQGGEWKVASDCWSSDVGLSLGKEPGATGGASAPGAAPSRSNRNLP